MGSKKLYTPSKYSNTRRFEFEELQRTVRQIARFQVVLATFVVVLAVALFAVTR